MSQNDFSKQVETVFRYNDTEFEFDIRDADDAEKFENALDSMKAAEAAAAKTGKMSEMTRAQCKMIKDFFDECFGENASKKLFGDKNNLSVCYDAYQKFLDIIRKQKNNLLQAKNAFSQHSNRQQRRHPNNGKKQQ